ncbi:hypothetical protein ACP70R_023309 [Stipagrostis hirtigluma subsp. patula]
MSSPPAPGSGATTRTGRRCTLDPGPRWASLPDDLVAVVASRALAGDLLDYVRFRAVCTGWRSATASPRGRGVADPRFHPRRWMMLPKNHCLYSGHLDPRGYVGFLNLDTGAVVRVRLPLLGDHSAIESVDGLLLLLQNEDQEGAVRLLHPFTGDVAELPPLGTLLPQVGTQLLSFPAQYRIRKLANNAFASVSFSDDGTMTIMLALHEVRRVAFATSMDRHWTLSSWEYPQCYTSPVSSQGKLYMVCPSSGQSNGHQILQINPPVHGGAVHGGGGTGGVLQPPKLMATIPARKLVFPRGLVECGSKILVLGHKDFSESQILVCKLEDLVMKWFIPIKSIGGNTLFLGERNISVSSKALSTVKGDNVVYIHSTQSYVAHYHLRSGTLSSAIDDCSLYGRAPGPSSLTHYIFSCCIRNRWNRGMIFRMNLESLYGAR